MPCIPSDPALSGIAWQRIRLKLIRAYRGKPTIFSCVRAARGLIVWSIDVGQVEVHSEFGRFVAGPGTWIMHATSRRLHDFSPDSRIRSVQLDLDWPSGANVLAGPTPLIVPQGETAEIEKAVEAVLAYALTEAEEVVLLPEHARTFAEAMGLHAVLFSFAATMVTCGLRHGWRVMEERQMDPRVVSMLVYVDNHPLSKSFDKTELANAVTLGSTHVNRLFTKSQGMTPKRYFDQRRLDFACDHLSAGVMGIKEIASELGFTSLQHFSAWFRKHLGVSPRQHRG